MNSSVRGFRNKDQTKNLLAGDPQSAAPFLIESQRLLVFYSALELKFV